MTVTRAEGIDGGGLEKWSMALARGSERCTASAGSSGRMGCTGLLLELALDGETIVVEEDDLA
jgi:hypothetical protein